MDFSDEPYVRLYPRPTITSRRLGWEGRVVLRMMLEHFDAAGIFAISGPPSECISLVTDLPEDIAAAGLRRLVSTGTWIVTADAITWPRYEEAQNCMRSDRLRQRQSRRARAAKSVTDVTPPSSPVTSVTTEPATVTIVTSGHAESRNVTLPSSHPSKKALSGAPARVAIPDPDPEPSAAPHDATPFHGAEPAQTDPPTHVRIPDDWVVSEAFYGEALAAGVTRPYLDEDVTYWRGRKLGGEWFSIEQFFRSHFPRLKKRRETEEFQAMQARDGPKRAGSRGNSDVFTYALNRISEEESKERAGT